MIAVPLPWSDPSLLFGEPKKLIRRPSQVNLNKVVNDTRSLVGDAVDAYLEEGDERAFGGRMVEALREGLRKAVVMGRQRAGDFAEEDEDDQRFAELLVNVQVDYLREFVRDLAAGRYEDDDGMTDEAAIRRRALYYPQCLTGGANQNFTLASGEDAVWDWRLGDTEDSCDECPDREAGSPYASDALPGVPGDCSTPCLFNCRCSIVRDDGISGFTLPPLD